MLLRIFKWGAQDELKEGCTQLKTELDKAIRGCQFFLDNKMLAHDEYWMAKQASLKLGGDYENWANGLLLAPSHEGGDMRIFAESAGHPVLAPPYIALPKESKPRQILSPFQDYGVLKIMALAFQCMDDCDNGALQELLLHVSTPGYGYGVTHQLWALVSVYNRRLISEEEYLRLAPALAIAVYEEMIACLDYSDITFERMAFLCYAGLGNWVPEKFVRFALLAQNEDGSWPKAIKKSLIAVNAPDKNGLISMEHTVSLALYAFADMRTKCPNKAAN